METINARELVIGFPKLAKVTAGARGTLRIEAEGKIYGLNLETGARITPEPEQRHDAPLVQPTMPFVETTGAKLGYADKPQLRAITWGGRPVVIDYAVIDLKLGDDDFVLACKTREVVLLDRANAVVRRLEVPDPIDLHDRVTGGMSGSLSGAVYVEPGFVVFLRSPSVLVVPAEDLRRAIVFDEVRWAIETILATREPELAIDAARGKWRKDQVVTASGSLEVDTTGTSDPVRAIDRLWPPNGWARVELADGTTMTALKPPREFRTIDKEPVTTAPLFWDVPRTRDWIAVEVPDVPVLAGYEDLRVPREATIAAALDVCERVMLDTKQAVKAKFAYRTAFAKFASAEALRPFAADVMVNHELVGETSTPAAVYAIPALVAIAGDPAAQGRGDLACALAAALRRALWNQVPRTPQPNLVYAFRKALPLILVTREVTDRVALGFGVIVALLARADNYPTWWTELVKINPDVARFAEARLLANALHAVDDERFYDPYDNPERGDGYTSGWWNEEDLDDEEEEELDDDDDLEDGDDDDDDEAD
ncbi:MAG: hypothetical protein QM831_06645 [Kofleriaceae bacterium]